MKIIKTQTNSKIHLQSRKNKNINKINLKQFRIVIIQIINLKGNAAMIINQLKIIFIEMSKWEQDGEDIMKT